MITVHDCTGYKHCLKCKTTFTPKQTNNMCLYLGGDDKCPNCGGALFDCRVTTEVITK